MTRQDHLLLSCRSRLSVLGQAVELEAVLVSCALDNGNVSLTGVNASRRVSDVRLFAVVTECEFKESFVDGECHEIFTVEGLALALTVPGQQTVRLLGREHDSKAT